MEKDVLPALRADLEFVPVVSGGRRVIAVHDELGLGGGDFVLQEEIVPLLVFFDGRHRLSDLHVALVRLNNGVLVGREEALNLVDALDRAYLLDTERYREAREDVRRRYASLSVREPAFAGRGYPADREELEKMLDGILEGKDGAGTGDGAVTAVVAPHIDIGVGRELYGAAYRAVRGAAPESVIVLGVGHRMAEGLFCLTEKDFRTPLGTIPVDREAVEMLRNAAPGAVAPDDFPHRGEHSIEFQVLFLRRVLAGEFRLIPVLCGSVAGEIERAARLGEVDAARPFLDTLKALREERWEATLVVAGVDLSHVGRKFGHDRTARELSREAERHDRALLDRVCAGDARGLWKTMKDASGFYNVCGFSALACLLEVCGPGAGTGRVLGYRMWHEEATASAVGFAAVVFAGGDG